MQKHFSESKISYKIYTVIIFGDDIMKNFFGEFKKFVMRGNVMDMAVGVVIGSAFSAIVTSLVNDIIMPLIGVLVGNASFSELSVVIGGTADAPVLLAYGAFIQKIIDFLIIAFCIFIVVKSINALSDKLKRKEEEEKAEEEAAPPAKPDDVVLLEEIRDLLKNKG